MRAQDLELFCVVALAEGYKFGFSRNNGASCILETRPGQTWGYYHLGHLIKEEACFEKLLGWVECFEESKGMT